MTLPETERLGPVRLVFTDRRGGVSHSPWDSLNLADHVGDDPAAVAENRLRLAAHLQVGPAAVVRAEHGSRVHVVEQPGTAEPGDAIVTRRPGLALLALSADCVAGVIAAPDIGAVAVFHSGWRGVAANTAAATVAVLSELGAAPGQLLAQLGPAICARCYAVSDAVRETVATVAPPAATRSAAGAPTLNITAGVVWQLAEAGVVDIRTQGRCTAEDSHLFSHRRDAQTGRQGVLAVLGGSSDNEG